MRRRAAAVLPVLLLVSLPSTAAHAQVHQSGISPGTRVRVSAPALSQRAVIGRYDNVNADSLSLIPTRTGSLLRIPLSEITRLELSDGRDYRRGVRVGGLFGLAVPTGLGFVCAVVCDDGALAPIGGVFLGAFVVLPVGATIGALLAPERWLPIPAPTETGR